MKTYGIKKEGYQINSFNKSMEDSDGKRFWNFWHTLLAKKAQYYVYELAYQLAVKHNLSTVLDVGCGIGRMLKKFFKDGFRVYGIDQPSGIKECTAILPAGIFLVDNIASANYKMKEYLKTSPLIICADVIEHLDDPDQILDYIQAFCDKDTLVVISTPERAAIAGKDNKKPNNPYHVREWAFHEFKEYIAQAGFEIVEHTLVRPGRFCFDLGTALYIVEKSLSGLPLKQTQVVVCRLKQPY